MNELSEKNIDELFVSFQKSTDHSQILTAKQPIIKLIEKYSYKEKNYFMMQVNNNLLKKLFLIYAILYSEDSVEIKNMIGIDFEFNSGKIALCQVGFYPNVSDKKNKKIYVYIFDPKDLNENETHLLIEYVFVQKNSYKVMHGSDSIDIPYIYEELFNFNKKLMIDFTKCLIDTRFLCEYYKILFSDNKKCSLYNALNFFGIISDKKYLQLEQNNKNMGPIYKVIWNIDNMNKNQLIYAAYDVIYLKQFVNRIFKLVKSDFLPHFKFICPIYRLWCYEKYGLTTIKQSALDINIEMNIPFEFETFLEINNFKKLLIAMYKLILTDQLNTNELKMLGLNKLVKFAEYFAQVKI